MTRPKPPENRTRWRMSCYRCGEHQETRPYGPGGALIVAALDSAGDTLTGEEACGIALGVLRRVAPGR